MIVNSQKFDFNADIFLSQNQLVYSQVTDCGEEFADFRDKLRFLQKKSKRKKFVFFVFVL